jgi:MFS family permease
MIPTRYRIVGLLFLMTIINYMDRVNISIAAPVMMKEMSLDPGHFGLLFSAFFVGYTLFQIPGGWLVDRLGGRKTLVVFCVGWSIFTLLTPLGALGWPLMFLLRFFVGLFEAASFPAVTEINSRWVPQKELATAQQLALAGTTVGPILAYPLTTWMITSHSWKAVFYLFASFGFFWALAWWAYTTDPAKTDRTRIQESIPVGDLLRSRPVLFLAAAYFFCLCSVSLFYAWLPTYLVQARGFTIAAMGWVGMLPMISGLVGGISGAVASDALLRRGFGPDRARRIPAILAGSAAAVMICLAAATPSPLLAVSLLSLFLFLFSAVFGGFWSIPYELHPRATGSISSMMNLGGSLGSILGPWMGGYLVRETGNWALPFYTVGAMSFLMVVVLVLLRVRPISLSLRVTPTVPA